MVNTRNTFQDTRQHILATGYQLVVKQGFHALGLSQLLKTAEVPKGSFYHYFRSKEHFGECLIDFYLEHYTQKLQAIFSHPEHSAYQKILAFFDAWMQVELDTQHGHRCLVVKLSGEVADLSEPMRQGLNRAAERIMARLADLLAQGIEDGSVTALDPKSHARHLYQTWLGACLLHKLSQDVEILENTFALTAKWLSSTSLEVQSPTQYSICK
ncbi:MULTISPECIES: TetR/AcrR family transcriptional regulator [unclassified Vibrio]|uniref:TetR/AcrR family transcriptional regulator n=1 Tax=Vibrio sp. HB236076 TaxID=3232307 RepID=A0AB39HA27_9VIBR|nr:TetR/AcrR family transcriptional regulator [Vibrio sp. HB161653]MDP5255377.1 TetR/AcrR family transcriptional regulator [Vibrio sp. HB161653]